VTWSAVTGTSLAQPSAMLPGATIHEGSSGDPEALAEVFERAVTGFERERIPYVLVGGLAAALLE